MATHSNEGLNSFLDAFECCERNLEELLSRKNNLNYYFTHL